MKKNSINVSDKYIYRGTKVADYYVQALYKSNSYTKLNNRFLMFMKNYPELITYESNLKYFFFYYIANINMTLEKLANLNDDENKNSFEQLQLLRFMDNNDIDRIVFSNPKTSIKIESKDLIEKLTDYLLNTKSNDTFIILPYTYKTYDDYVNAYNYCITNAIKVFGNVLISERDWTIWKKYIRSKSSAYKILVQTFYGLFNYLKNETCFKNKTNVELYDFIIDFTAICGLNWSDVSLTPNNYLKDLFKTL